MTTLAEAFKAVDSATTAHDLFNGDKAKAQRIYRALAKALHPDHVPAANLSEANAAFAKLSTMWDAYASGDAGRTFASVTIATSKRAYVVGDLVAQGDIAGLYRAQYREDDTTHDVILKMTRTALNNDLVENEARVLKQFADKVDPTGLPFVTQLLDTLRFSDSGSGVQRSVNVLTPLDGFYTLEQVRAAYPDGLDIRDVMWMWKRLLIAIGHAHRAGVVHGAVLPQHVLIHPDEHGLVLVDWCYAAIALPIKGKRFVPDGGWHDIAEEYDTDDVEFPALKALVPTHQGFYTPEALARKQVTPQTDVVMATRTIQTLFNDATPLRIKRFAEACVKAPDDDSWKLMQELTDLAAEHFPRAFRPFAMPS